MNSPELITQLKAYPLGVLEELRKVSWPSKELVRRQTLVVFVVVVVASLFVAGLDQVFRQGITFILQ